MFGINVVDKTKTRFILSDLFLFLENRDICEVMWKNIVEPERPQMKKIAHAPCTLNTQGYEHTFTTCNDFYLFIFYFFKLIYYTDSTYKVYKDKLQNCSCNQFHYIDTYKQVEKNSMAKNRGGNDGSEK